jgi:hypothetical protein
LAILIQNVSKKSGPVKISCHITFFELQLVFSEIGSIKLLVKFIKVRLFENSQVLKFFTGHFLNLFLYILGYLKLCIYNLSDFNILK